MGRRVVRVHPEAIDAVIAHARATLPDECCGLLLGAPDVVTRAWPARNLAASPTRYRVDPVDHFAAIRGARSEGREVVGAYHSHPRGPLAPSRTDRHDAHPDFLYLIVSPAEGRVEAWMLEDGDFRVLDVVIDGNAAPRPPGP
jgi:proteasome lid subunit RPN8/RPN11